MRFKPSGGGTFFLRINLVLMGAVPCDQAIDVIAVRPVGAKSFFVEKTLDPATHANLVRVTQRTDGPAHLVMPATPQQHDRSASQTGGGYAQGPEPARFLLLQFVCHSL